jgi:predicted patatin/cPLA2 family phospholipase
LTCDFLRTPPDDTFIVQIAPSEPLKSSSLLSSTDDLMHDYELGREAGFRFVKTYLDASELKSERLKQHALSMPDHGE